ncbi:serine/threonine-protein kinase [Litoribrevibacter euphylliae]|uniref:Serine/threonine-protein kinase n=1 Tax=Litoribrevibacter euphylliae TaxID=1834034 RepID=A0ABV7HCW9_9GAMM
MTDKKVAKNVEATESKTQATPTSSESTVTDIDNDKTQADLNRSISKKVPVKSLEGQCIKDRYLLESKIGSGGMSDIYRAKDLLLERAGIKDGYIAIKVLQPEFVKQPEALQLLMKEADKTRRLSHPNIIRLYDVDSDGDIHFLIMEYLDGETLDQIIKRSKPKGLKLKGAIKLLEQISAALTYAHQQGIVHTDLKPANIILTRNGHIKLLDFGVAQAVQVNQDQYSADSNQLTSVNGGYTPAYASPQLLEGSAPSFKDDVFSFACLAYELLTSKHPYDRLPANKAKEQKKTTKKPSHLNASQWKCLQKALHLDDKDRTQDISTIIKSFSANPWPKVALAAGFVGSIGVASWFTYQQHLELDSIQAELAKRVAHSEFIEGLTQIPSNQFLNQLQDLDTITATEKQGLLRAHGPALIESYEKKVDQALNDGEHEYPNYPKAEKLLNEILDFYPDSHILTKQAITVTRGKQAAIQALDERLHASLRKGNYDRTGSGIFYLLEELKYIDNNYRPIPTSIESKVYQKQFNSAMKSHDVSKLESLIDVGNVFFSKTESVAELLALGQQLKQAITELSAYSKQISEGQELDYPYQAATVFYKDSFETLTSKVSATTQVSSMDKLYKEVETLSQDLPDNFPPLISIRKAMADKYLNLADILLKKRKVKTANRVMKRANELISSTNI